MRLAEALSLRADRRRRVEQLRARITANATYQEGAEPAEDASALLTEADEVLDELETLIGAINRTNSATALAVSGGGADSFAGTMTDALATRDALRMRHGMLVAAADAASGHGHGVYRQLRSELRQISALPVAELRARADAVAREIRELDARIQQANWTVDLTQ
jgi:hypothetical protein